MGITCPTQEELKSLTLGQLSDEQSDRLILHLNVCHPCQSEMGTLESAEDTFVEQLRSVSELVDGDVLDDEISSETECRVAAARALGALAEVETGAAPKPKQNVPRSIGEYDVVKPLGHGGMGHVYLGRHTKLNRIVAIKFIADHRRWDKTMHQRFASEMRTIGSLNHPNIVVAHDAREVDGLAVLVTEFIDGMDVSELLQRNGQLSIADSIAIVQEVCRALKYIDSKKLIHRDIKPSNIIIDGNGSVKLLDLGLAKLQTGSEQGEFTATGQAIGTADYVAPEQINDGRNVDIRADIYGLGCTLYKLLAGRAPFALPQHSTAFSKMNAHVSETPEPIENLRPDVPKALSKLVHGMLEKAPVDRPQTADEVIKQISSIPVAKGIVSLSSLSDLVKTSRSLPRGGTDLKQLDSESRRKPTALPQTDSAFGNGIPWAAIASTLLAFALGIWLGITLTIKKENGETTMLTIPDGSTAVVDSEGNVEIQIGNSTDRVTIPAARINSDLRSVGTDFVNKDSKPSAPTREIVKQLPPGSPLRGKLEPGDLVDFIGVPDMQSEPFKSGDWPVVLATKVEVNSVADSGTRIEHVTLSATKEQEKKFASLPAGYTSECRFHEKSRDSLLAKDKETDGAWRVVSMRIDGETRTDDVGFVFAMKGSKFMWIDDHSARMHNLVLGTVNGDSGRIKTYALYNTAEPKGGVVEKIFIQRGIYRILESGRMEFATSSDPDDAAPKNFDSAAILMRLERIVQPDNSNKEQTSFIQFRGSTAPSYFEISLGTSRPTDGVTITESPVEITDTILYGREFSDQIANAVKMANQTDADPSGPQPVPVVEEEGKTKVWMGPRLIASRDVAKAEAFQLEIESDWSVLVELTELGSQKIAYMTEKLACLDLAFH